MILWVLACTQKEPDPPAVDPKVAVRQAEALVQEAIPSPVVTKKGEPIPLVFTWTGIGALHRSFFLNEEATNILAEGLSGSVKPPANIHVAYDSEDFVGAVHLQLVPGSRQLAVNTEGARLDLSALSAIMMPLAQYRDFVGGRFDIRVQSFKVGIEAIGQKEICQIVVAGTPPHDGRVVSPCVFIEGAEVCGNPGPAGVTFSPSEAATLRRCLELK